MSKGAAESIRTFGEILPGVQYTERPGGYAFIQNGKREFAVVKTPNGLFLPGGGLEKSEDIETGLRRELHEEIGFVVTRSQFILSAIQYHWSEHYQTHFKKIGSFFEVEGSRPAGAHLEKDHSLLWLPGQEVERILTQEFQRFAVAQYLRGT
jgi:8-oxo-dGTP diphosphatase